MNETLRLLGRHRSIRRFAPEPVPDADVRAAVDAGRRASTSSAVEAWSCLRVRDPATRARLVELTGDQEKVAAAGALLVVCGDSRRHRLAAAGAGTAYRGGLEEFLVAVIDASLFAQNIAVAFESMGYGICYIGGLRNRLAEVDALLGLPEGVYPLFGLCAGRPAEDPAPRPRLPLEAVFFDGRYPEDDTLRALLARHDARVVADPRSGGRPWTTRMAERFGEPRRTDLGTFYESKGAALD